MDETNDPVEAARQLLADATAEVELRLERATPGGPLNAIAGDGIEVVENLVSEFAFSASRNGVLIEALAQHVLRLTQEVEELRARLE